jgi:hypothetical protein
MRWQNCGATAWNRPSGSTLSIPAAISALIWRRDSTTISCSGSRELQAAFPDIVGPHALRQVWAFKYDQHLSGIPPHADAAAVNVNLWIAPDDACPDPDAGGLLVYPVKVPADWGFVDYNSINPRFDAFIRDHGGTPHRIGHRQNRALLFSSDAIHATESVDFRPGYLNRRINITMLFGYR